MSRVVRVGAAGIGGGIVGAAFATAASGASTLGKASVIVLQMPPSTASLTHFNEWHVAILVAIALLLTGVSLAIHRGRIRKPLGWSGIALLLAACGVIVFLPAHSATSNSVELTATEHSFLAAINHVRLAHSDQPLQSQSNLVRAARAHSRDMIEHNYFAHGVFWKRLESFGVRGRDLAENLAWDSTTDNAVGTLMHAWLESPDHRANLLSNKYSEIGVGVDIGAFHGYPSALMVTTDFLGN
jgi:uncharacterized protein YkwD